MRSLKRDSARRLPSAGAMVETIEASAEAEGIVLGERITQAYVRELFPGDEAKQAERVASAERLYHHVRLQPALLVAQAASAELPSRRSRRLGPYARAALALCALSLTALAAASTMHLLARGAPDPAPAQAATPAPRSTMVSRELPVELPAAQLPAPELPHARPVASPAKKKPSGASHRRECATFITLTKGPVTICKDRHRGQATHTPRHR